MVCDLFRRGDQWSPFTINFMAVNDRPLHQYFLFVGTEHRATTTFDIDFVCIYPVRQVLDFFKIRDQSLFYIFIFDIELNELDILVSPMNTSGIIRYPTNTHTIGANPITFPISPFFDISLLFDSLRFSW